MPTRRNILKNALGVAAAASVPITLDQKSEASVLPPSPPEVGFKLMFPDGVVPPYTCGDIVRYGHGPDSYLQQMEVIEVGLDYVRVVRRW